MRRTTISGITYELTRKTVKNLNLRIHPDGSIHASCPRKMGAERADAFVEQKKEWIGQVRARLASQIQAADTLLLLGKKIPYTVELGPAGVCARNGRLVITAPEASRAPAVAAAWRESRLRPILAAALARAQARFQGFELPPYQVKIKRMTSRWGSCHREKKVLSFSTFLMCVPPEAIEYVAAHELAHFFAAGHGADFYAVMDRVMPDHRRRRAMLRSSSPRAEKEKENAL